jgi:hypothetical protein
MKGSADILGCLPGGKFLAVETKAPAGRLSPEQLEFLEKIRGIGGVAIVAHSAWELDALKPEVLDALITASIKSNLDQKKSPRNKETGSGTKKHSRLIAVH